MTTGRINQVHTIGGARASRAPPARVRAGGGAPTRARAPPPAPAPPSPRPPPRPGPGGFRRTGASPCGSEERASGGAGGRAAHVGWPPRALARQPPVFTVLAWPDRVPASFWFTRSERLRLHASSHGAPLGTVRLRTATQTKAWDPSATASALPLGRPPPRKDTSRLRGGHRSPHAPGPSRCDGAQAPGYGRQTAGRRPGLGSVGVRSWRPGRRQRPCHRALCVLTRRGCPILYVPAQCAPAKTERPPPIPKWEGRREASSSSPPIFGRGGASGALAGGPRPRPGSRLGAAHLRTGGAEECTGTADTNPGCNYLVRCYSPFMHYFWRGDTPHFSSPLPFQRGARGCRAAAVPRPLRRARLCAPSISAGMAPLAGTGQRTPLQTGGQLGAARAAQVRRGVTAAISNWPAAPAAGQPQQARPPHRRRPCNIFTLLLILLTTPS